MILKNNKVYCNFLHRSNCKYNRIEVMKSSVFRFGLLPRLRRVFNGRFFHAFPSHEGYWQRPRASSSFIAQMNRTVFLYSLSILATGRNLLYTA